MLYTGPVEFEWSEDKAEANPRKHGVSFPEALTVWEDPRAEEFLDCESTNQEERWVLIGHSKLSRLLVVVHCEFFEGRRMRIISARKATRNERRRYFSR